MTNLFVEEKKKKQNHPNKPTKNPPKPSKQKRNELHLKLCGSTENVEGQEIYGKWASHYSEGKHSLFVLYCIT